MLVSQFIKVFRVVHVCFPRGSHSLESTDRRHCLLELLYGCCAAQFKTSAGLCISHTAAQVEDIVAFLEDPAGLIAGHSAVIVTRDRSHRHLETQVLILSGIQSNSLSVGAQHSCGLSEFALGRFAVDLHHFFAGGISGVHNSDPEVNRIVPRALHSEPADFKVRIGQSESEGIEDLLLRKCFKISIPHIDIFCIEVPVWISEVSVRGIVAYIIRDRIRQLAAGRNLSRQHVQNAVSALLAALPYIEDRCRAIFCHPFHVDDISDIEKDNGPGKSRADSLQHLLLLPREVVAAALGFVVLVLAGGPADDHHRGVRLPGRCAHKFL